MQVLDLFLCVFHGLDRLMPADILRSPGLKFTYPSQHFPKTVFGYRLDG